MKKLKLTFKKQPKATGLSGIGYPYPNVDIKVDGKSVGVIYAPTWSSEKHVWTISFAIKKIVPDDNPNCDWKWKHIKGYEFASEEDARTWVKGHIALVADTYKLHSFDN